MKTRFSFWFCLFIFFSSVSFSQVPRGFNYMAIARNLSGEILNGTDLKIRIAILKSTDPLVYVWEEEHIVKTDDFGQFKLIVGDPDASWTEPPGGVDKFGLIDWNIQPLYIRTSILNGEVWEVMGDAQLFSVPYSLVSQNLSGANKLSVSGTTTNMEEVLFEVKNHLDQTVFAVYGDGVRMYVGDRTSKSAKGGFAIGEFGAKGKTDIQEYFTITPYEARINMNPPPPSKAPKGGFAIGEFGAKGGIIPTSFMDVTPKNYFIGHETGTLLVDGEFNSVIGYQAGKNITTGDRNTILGHQSGTTLSGGSNNILIGDMAGFSLTSGIHNTLIGNSAGYKHTNQQYNVMIGTGAGYSINALGSSFNTFMGINAGNKIQNSIENTFIGTNAGAMLEDGYSNTIVGIDAGRGGAWDPGTYHSYVTSQNTILGCGAGYSLDVGTGNVFIGYQAGYWETGTIATPANNKLYISNSAGTPLIGGNFATGQVGINRMPATNAFEVNGEASKTTAGSWLANSDARIKINISDIENAEETLLKLHPVKFRYSDEWKNRNPSIQNKYYYNFIAQEFREVFPEAVQGSGEYINGDAEELLQLDSYSSQIVAIKALQEEIIKNRLQQVEIEKLRKELDELKLIINNLRLNKSETK